MDWSLDTGSIPVGSTKKTMENDTFSIVFFIHCESNGIDARRLANPSLRSLPHALACIFLRLDAYRLRYLASFVVYDRQIANIQRQAVGDIQGIRLEDIHAIGVIVVRTPPLKFPIRS